jgi:transcription-repair coupling factor (superfamily II helicase)
MDGKQVALLAPTTILSEQHYLTFKERLKRFPVRIAVINRFKSMLEQKQIVEGIKNNEIDILIGTHRLIQKDIQFHDLGLVIIDEEQRFGVMHKERLKKMKSTVDVLTLTATPIPRTLYLSLTGIRDISVIETPPEGRKPVHTVVASRSQKMIKEAIQYELERKGQVFYVSPRIKSLMKIYEELVLLFPECQIGIAHGRLSGPDLEKVMEKFYNAEIDILLCTTIIEIG